MAIANIEPILRPRYAAITALVAATLLAGCSADRMFNTSSVPEPPPGEPRSVSPGTARSSSLGSRVLGGMTDFFSDSSASGPVTAGGAGDVECPTVDVRMGASTLTIPPGSNDATAMALRYQGSIGEMGRTCRLVGGNTLKMKVGIQGRIVLGPAGGPGNVDVPLRFAVVHEGPEPKTVVSKFYKIAVTIPQGQLSVPFVNIDEDISFPMPKGDDLDSYIVYVGFDPVGAAATPKKPAPRSARAR
jgi:hypothetical protein